MRSKADAAGAAGAGEVGELGQPWRDLSAEELERRTVGLGGGDEHEAVRRAAHEVVGDDHALGRQQRAVDEAIDTGCREVVGEQALQAVERAAAHDAEHGGPDANDDAAAAQCSQLLVGAGNGEG